MLSDSPIKYPLILAIGFIATYILVPIVIAIATKIGMVDQPSERRVNTRAIPRGGGVAVFLGFQLACAAVFFLPWQESFASNLTLEWWHAVLAASGVLLLVGLLDDRFQIAWWLKLTGQVVAALIMFQHGASVNLILGFELPPTLNLVITIAWYLAFINSFNLIDGLDGLATGLATIAALGLSGFAFLRNAPGDALVLLGLVGASLAFLRFNFYPARVFLGDSGSMFIGFILAAIALGSGTKAGTLAAIGAPLLAIGVPFFDTVLAIWRRSVRGVLAHSDPKTPQPTSVALASIAQPDLDHLHHRMLRSGRTQRAVAMNLYLVNALLVGLAILTRVCSSYALGMFMIAFAIGSYVVVRHIARVELWDSGRALLQGLHRPRRSMLRGIFLPAFDAIAISFSLFIVVVLFSGHSNISALRYEFATLAPVWCSLPFVAIFLSGAYTRVWGRARITDFVGLAIAVGLGVIIAVGLSMILSQLSERFLSTRFMLGAMLLHGCLVTIAACSVRALPRAVQDAMGRWNLSSKSSLNRLNVSSTSRTFRTVIYGAGSRGILLLRHRSRVSQVSGRSSQIIGFIDDDLLLRGRVVHGFPVLGSVVELQELYEQHGFDKIVVAADLNEARLRVLREFAHRRNLRLVEWKISMHDLSPGQPTAETLGAGLG